MLHGRQNRAEQAEQAHHPKAEHAWRARGARSSGGRRGMLSGRRGGGRRDGGEHSLLLTFSSVSLSLSPLSPPSPASSHLFSSCYYMKHGEKGLRGVRRHACRFGKRALQNTTIGGSVAAACCAR